MAEKLCNLRKYGGGSLKETTLWTNNSPTSSFASQTVTLSDYVSNYDYIKITFRLSTSSTDTLSILVPKEDYSKYDGTSSGAGVMHVNSNTGYCRLARTFTGTSINFAPCWTVFAAAGSNNNLLIPVSIVGIK